MYQDWMKEVPVLGDIEIDPNIHYYFEKYCKNYCPMCGRKLKEEDKQ